MISNAIYYTELVTPYYKARKGWSCPIDDIIQTEKSCTAASFMLGLIYQFNLDDPDSPPGCRYNDRTKHSYANIYNGLAPNNAKHGWGYGGVCERNGRL